MKKVLTLLLSLMFLLGLVACDTSTAGDDADSGDASGVETTADESEATTAETTADAIEQIGSGTVDDHDITIKGFRLSKDYKDKDAVIITYEWTNNSDASVSFLFAVSTDVFQNGINCETAIITDDDSYDSAKSMNEIKPGITYTVDQAYTLQDTQSEIEVEITPLLSFDSDPPMIKQTFDITK